MKIKRWKVISLLEMTVRARRKKREKQQNSCYLFQTSKTYEQKSLLCNYWENKVKISFIFATRITSR